MFGISGFKLMIIVVAVLILVGPEKLPEIGRTVGKAIAMFKRAQEDMQSVITAEMFSVDSTSESSNDASGAAQPEKNIAATLYTATDEDEEEEDEE